MKPVALLTLLAGVLLASGAAIPRKAPPFIIQTVPPKGIFLNRYAGKTIVLAFVLTDCSHCQFTTRLLNSIQKDYASRGVQVVESALDTLAAARVADFRKKLVTNFPVGFNRQDDAARFLGYDKGVPMIMPGVVFIDRNGIIQAQLDGEDKALASSDQDKNLRLILERTIKQGEKPSRPPASKEKKTP
jgi:peroxiredoxin